MEQVRLAWLVVWLEAALAVTVGTVWLSLAAELTVANRGDNAVAPLWLEQMPGEVRYVLGDTHSKALPSGGAWRAWYARLGQLIHQYHEHQDDAGWLMRRALRVLDSLWVLLGQHGVEPTNNRAERALGFGVLWRKRSLDTAGDKGNRWVERILSLRETCRLHAHSTYESLAEAVSSLFTGQQADLAWIGQ